MENIAIKVVSVEKEAIESLSDQIIRIMETKADQETLRVALRVFSDSVNTGPITISGNRINMGTFQEPVCEEDSE